MFSRAIGSTRYSVPVVMLACAALAGIGCSGGTTPPVGGVEGTVTLDGSLFGEGRIEFHDPTTAFGGGAELKPDGSFTFESPEGGLRQGTYNVTIIPLLPPALDPIESAKGVTAPPVTTKIPKKYQDATTSGFSLKVGDGKIPADFAMKSN
jgi:hypothetical protein